MDELLTSLYLENLQLKSQHIKKFEPQPIAPPSIEAIEANSEYDMFRAYSRRTTTSYETAHAHRHLVIANEYPKRGREYGNGFVHKRVKQYQEYGAHVDVVAFGKRVTKSVYSHEGVDVLAGYVYELSAILKSRSYDSISVHFPNSEMWNVIHPHLNQTPFHFFIHGYEARRWIRTFAEVSNPLQLANSMARTWHLQSFWKYVAGSNVGPRTFFFVSDFWRRAVRQDMEVAFPFGKEVVVHNFIDTEHFKYDAKPTHQRFKILWLRSASAKHYGADIAAECLRTLRGHPLWEKMQILIIGDGVHFSEFKEFEGEKNVVIDQSFKTQKQIAEIHKDYGIFLVPTRLDSQGVSRDEAMSSGLVPVTNLVAAVPEFVDSTCALISPPEDGYDMAQKIVRLMNNSDLFSEMSVNAARRVRMQCAEEHTVQKEAIMMGMLERDQ